MPYIKKIINFGFIPLFLTSQYLYADNFTPNGSVGVTQTFYGNSGGYGTSSSHPSFSFNYNLTPKWSTSIDWDRAWNLHYYDGQENKQNNNISQPKVAINYNYGKIGNSKIGLSSSITAVNQATFNGSNQTHVLSQTNLDLSEYIPKNDFIEATQFAIAPMYVYGWTSKGTSGHENAAILSLLTNWKLSHNFSFTFQAYGIREWYDGSMQLTEKNNKYSNANYLMLFAWLNYNTNIYQFNEQTSLNFNFIGGYDPYISSNRRGAWDPFIVGNQMYEWMGPTVMNGNYKTTYTLFALPQISLVYDINKSVSVNTFIQAKYSNQVWGDNEKDWRVQPQVGIGLQYDF